MSDTEELSAAAWSIDTADMAALIVIMESTGLDAVQVKGGPSIPLSQMKSMHDSTGHRVNGYSFPYYVVEPA